MKENGDDVKKRVCRNMFINTLSIGEKTVRSWTLSDQPSTSLENEDHQAQAVLLALRLNASANYYKTKLKVHNETFFNLSTKDAVCYVWHEAVAGIESDVFASIYTDFLKKAIEKKRLEKITIWSDGCGYQNRNIKLSNALLELSIKTKVIIEQKYLEVGHTFMEVDSIHSTIEQKLRNRREVYTPADYIPIIQSARQRPRPYETIYCSSDDFYAFQAVYYKSIRPGNKIGDPCVNDVVAFQYTPNGIIHYKLRFQDEWAELPVRPKRLESLPDHPKLYTGPIPIEASKYTHLQELKELIPQDYRQFYENLVHK
ncbi:unnamed protein product [Parnassius apollo]|uniref:(apollo) hypothetical protein n=1 Tax=Parnassius apollo TaxID=110799 RepID=A0A8S3W2J4_PARAO|nr:unnamed protein product [Parnassius apollo]